MAASVELFDAPTPAAKGPHKPVKLRASITPGTILILLAGRSRGKRVVFLGQLPSGLLLVAGPHKVNGVPLKRVNQAYVIATSTKVDLSGVKLPEVGDAVFKKAKQPKNKDMFEDATQQQKKKESSPELMKLNAEVEAKLLPAIKKVPALRSYLKTSFSLQKGQAPHSLKF